MITPKKAPAAKPPVTQKKRTNVDKDKGAAGGGREDTDAAAIWGDKTPRWSNSVYENGLMRFGKNKVHTVDYLKAAEELGEDADLVCWVVASADPYWTDAMCNDFCREHKANSPMHTKALAIRPEMRGIRDKHFVWHKSTNNNSHYDKRKKQRLN